MSERVVLFIDCSYGFGGAIKSLGLTLRRLDGTAHVLTSQKPGLAHALLGSRYAGGIRRIVNYHTLGPLRRHVQRIRLHAVRRLLLTGIAAFDRVVGIANARRVKRFCRRNQVDLIHVNNNFTPYEAFVAARSLKIPCVVHLRDFVDPYYPLKPVVRDNTACIITVSDAVASALAGTSARGLPTVTIHDPVDTAAMDAAMKARAAVRKMHGIADDEIAVGIFGRVIQWKGQREFLEAAIAAASQDPRIRPVIVGDESDGGRAYMEAVRALASQSGLGDRIIFAGYQSEVEPYYAAMDIVVHASITPEPFGMVVPEAMAARRAVIAADAGGPREVITPGVDGLLVPPCDTAALAEAILLLAADPAARERLGAAARVTVEQRLGLDTNAAAIQSVHESLLRRGKCRDATALDAEAVREGVA